MHAGALRGDHDLLRIDLAKACNVFTDGAAEQLDILRQITDIRAQLILAPLINIRAIQPHLAGSRRPDANDQARQCRFAGTAGADDAERIAWLNLKAETLDDRHATAWRRCGDRLQRHMPGRRRQFHAGFARRIDFQQFT